MTTQKQKLDQIYEIIDKRLKDNQFDKQRLISKLDGHYIPGQLFDLQVDNALSNLHESGVDSKTILKKLVSGLGLRFYLHANDLSLYEVTDND